MVTSSGAIVSGGDDNKVRVWAVTNKGEDEEWKFVKAHELSLHTAPISCIVEHPSKPWICCAGKDGRCVIWDYTDGSLVVDIPCMVDGIAGSGSTGATVKMECRGCAFSSDGEFLYSIQSARKGSTYLIK